MYFQQKSAIIEDNDVDEDNVIIKMRMKYVEDLEQILECPICMDLPEGDVLTCLNGHHVCQKCKVINRRKNCPTCESDFNGSRNYVAEKIAAKFEDIKTSLLNPNHCSNRKIIQKSIKVQTVCKNVISTETQTVNEATTSGTQTNFSETSVECQTDFYGIDAEAQTEIKNIDDISIPSPDQNSNVSDVSSDEEDNNSETVPLITCFIKSCNDRYSTDTIVNHIKLNHKENIKETIPFHNNVVNDKYHTSWTFHYEANKSYDQAINIFEMGLIFFNVSIDEDGNVHGNIGVAKSYCNQDLYYLILIGNDEIFLSEIFKGVISSSADNNTESNKNIYVNKSIFADYILNGNQIFECSLTLYKPEI